MGSVNNGLLPKMGSKKVKGGAVLAIKGVRASVQKHLCAAPFSSLLQNGILEKLDDLAIRPLEKGDADGDGADVGIDGEVLGFHGHFCAGFAGFSQHRRTVIRAQGEVEDRGLNRGDCFGALENLQVIPIPCVDHDRPVGSLSP